MLWPSDTHYTDSWLTPPSPSAIRRYGKDFVAIAEVIGNKTVAQVSSFFVSYRRRFNLDEVLGEWQAEQEVPSAQGNPGKRSPQEAKEPGGGEDRKSTRLNSSH